MTACAVTVHESIVQGVPGAEPAVYYCRFIIRPHRGTNSATRPIVTNVLSPVCMFGHIGELCKTAEPIEMPFGVGPKSPVPAGATPFRWRTIRCCRGVSCDVSDDDSIKTSTTSCRCSSILLRNCSRLQCPRRFQFHCRLERWLKHFSITDIKYYQSSDFHG